MPVAPAIAPALPPPPQLRLLLVINKTRHLLLKRLLLLLWRLCVPSPSRTILLCGPSVRSAQLLRLLLLQLLWLLLFAHLQCYHRLQLHMHMMIQPIVDRLLLMLRCHRHMLMLMLLL